MTTPPPPTAHREIDRSDIDERFGPVPPISELVQVETVGVERYRGVSPHRWPGQRVFGGLVAAQSLMACGATIDGLRPHSLHAYFLRLGRPQLPLDYTVTRVRDGRSFATRSVEVTQSGEVIFTMIASFHHDEPGQSYQLNRTPSTVPGNEPADPPLPYLAALADLDVRDLGPSEPEADGTFRSTLRMWLRVREELPNDPLLHASIITLMSDMGTVTSSVPPREENALRPTMAASLDHAVWFHRDIRADDWLLYDLHSVSAAGARALTRGVMHSADGTLGVSVTQEALVRTAADS